VTDELSPTSIPITHITPEKASTIPRTPGTYLLLFRVTTATHINIGRLGHLRLTPGVYVYVGSARGPGGLSARIRRHLRREKRLHWHIDYITQQLSPTAILFTTHPHVTECGWVHTLLPLPGTETPLPGLGNSDCRAGCPAHFLRISEHVAQNLLNLLATAPNERA